MKRLTDKKTQESLLGLYTAVLTLLSLGILVLILELWEVKSTTFLASFDSKLLMVVMISGCLGSCVSMFITLTDLSKQQITPQQISVLVGEAVQKYKKHLEFGFLQEDNEFIKMSSNELKERNSLEDWVGSIFTTQVSRTARNWRISILIQPLLGMAVAVIYYLVFRAGIDTASGNGGTSQTVTQINLYAFAGTAAIVGLFSSKAIGKLKKVSSKMFDEEN